MYELLMPWHLGTVLLAFVLGTVQLILRPKGSPWHRAIGKAYMLLMLVTALIALFMPAHVGPALLGHFGWIHLLCLVVLWQVPRSWLAARRGNIAQHRFSMIAIYVLALLVAGAFTLVPGRYLHGVLFG